MKHPFSETELLTALLDHFYGISGVEAECVASWLVAGIAHSGISVAMPDGLIVHLRRVPDPPDVDSDRPEHRSNFPGLT